MELSVIERLYILGLLPHRSNISVLKIVSDLEDEIGFTEEDHKALKFRDGPSLEAGGRTITRWDIEAADEIGNVEFKFGEKAKELVAEGLMKLSNANELTIGHLSLWKKFVDADLRDISKEEPETEDTN